MLTDLGSLRSISFSYVYVRNDSFYVVDIVLINIVY